MCQLLSLTHFCAAVAKKKIPKPPFIALSTYKENTHFLIIYDFMSYLEIKSY